MGPKKVADAAPPAPVPGAPRPPIARGHRQKGSGHVIVGRAPVETAEGIILRAHERLPSVLLNEYCQREKRPMPKYHPAGRCRLAVVLADKKNPKDDLTFTPIQSFDSDKLARDFAALLALFHFQRSIPLERKLPEPFCGTWISMIATAKAEEAENKQAAFKKAKSDAKLGCKTGGDAVAAVDEGSLMNSAAFTMVTPTPLSLSAPPLLKSATVKPSTVSKTTVASSQSDWLCESCGYQNFATLASGLPRLNCIKCQTSRETSMTTIVSNGKTATGEDVIEIKKKAPPVAVLDLRSSSQFTSVAEKEKQDTEKRAQIKSKNTYFDALRRSNRPTSVLLSIAMRKLLENALGLRAAGSMISSDDEVDTEADSAFEIRIADLYSDIEAGEGEFFTGTTSVIQLAVAKELVAYLRIQGFSSAAVISCISSLITDNSKLCQERFVKLTTKDTSNRSAIFSLVREAALEFLCLNMNEDDLPVGFEPTTNEGREHLQVYTRACNEAPEQKCSSDMSRYTPCEKSLVSGLALFGWHLDDVITAWNKVRSIFHNDSINETTLDLLYFCTTMLLISVAACTTKASLKEVEDEIRDIIKAHTESEVKAELIDAIDDEASTLEAIFDTAFTQSSLSSYLATTHSIAGSISKAKTSSNFVVFSLSVSFPTGAFLHVLLSRNAYPAKPPLFLLATNDRSIDITQSHIALYKTALGMAGEVSVFQVYTYWEEYGRSLLSQKRNAGCIRSLFLSEEGENVPKPIESKVQAGSFIAVEEELDATDEETYSSRGSVYPSVQTRSVHPFWIPDKGKSKSKPNPLCSASKAMLEARCKLPAWASRETFLQTISSNRAMVVTGETGCGKTTQIPQFLIEAEPNAKIVICQPRRLAAVGVATRVAEELGCKVGETVGYMVRGDSKANATTRIIFCTYGVLLRRLQDDPMLDAVQYIILDEVHERGVDSDFCLALVLSALKRSSELKLILMSATISTSKFSLYLGKSLGFNQTVGAVASSEPSVKLLSVEDYQEELTVPPGGAPVLFIPGFTFPVDEFYRPDFEEQVYAFDSKLKIFDEDEIDSGSGYYRRKGEIDYALLVALISCLVRGHNCQNGMLERATGALLVFMPGLQEITKLINMLQSKLGGRDARIDGKMVKLMSLHGGLSPSEQRKVFQLVGTNEIKIVVSTNVAEASVTIPDVTVVIDSCRVKEIDFDVETQISSLQTKFASQDSLRQRRGRAGRVQKGRCFRIITINSFQKLPAFGIPEMSRVPLDNLILQIASMTLNESCYQILSRCPDPPDPTAIQAAIKSLSCMQALRDLSEGDVAASSNLNNFVLTSLGKHLSELPCSPKVGRLLIFGSLLGCTAPCSAIAASMNSKSPFLTSQDTSVRSTVDDAKQRFSRAYQGKESDQFAIAEACREFSYLQNVLRVGMSELRRFCNHNGLAYDTVVEICNLQRDLLQGVASLGFIESAAAGLSESHICNKNCRKAKVLSAALCAGFYPQLARVLKPPKKFVETIGGAIEKNTIAKELKLYIPEKPDEGFDLTISTDDNADTTGLNRVFVHPSSINFNATTFGNSFVMYGARQFTNKAYLRDITEVSAFPILFFGGKMVTNYANGLVTIDGWLRFSAPGRIVALVQGLRDALDGILEKKITDPSFDVYACVPLQVTVRLLLNDGLG